MLAATTYYYRIAAVDAAGQTLPSVEQSRATTAGNQTLNLSWTAVPGAAGFNIYRGTFVGGETL